MNSPSRPCRQRARFPVGYDLRELDENGNTKEGGITVEGAILMPSYIKVEEQKNLFNDAKVGDVITFNPKKAYPENDTEVSSLLKIEREAVADLESEFSFQITEIQRFKKHEPCPDFLRRRQDIPQ